MCGIVGMMTVNTANDKQLKALSHLLLLDQMRGEHATGVAKINIKTGEAKVHKRAVNAIDFLASEDTKEFLQKDRQHLYIGHNRFATMGKRDDSGAHPFQHKHITMVHNGTVDRWVLKDLSGYPEIDCTVDSDMVCRTIAEKGIEEACNLISGAFSLVWWNSEDKSLNFLRNERRPMWLCHTETTTMWASEKNFLQVLLAREDKYLEEYAPYELKPHTMYSWYYDEKGDLLHKGHAKVRKMEIKGVEDPFVGTRGNSWGNYYGSGGYSAQGSADARIAQKMKDNGLNLKVNQRIKVTVSKFQRTAMFDNHVALFGDLYGEEGNTVPFRTFSTRLSDLIPGFEPEVLKALPIGTHHISELHKWCPGLKEIFGDVNNCYAVSEKDNVTGQYVTFDRVILDNIHSTQVDAIKIQEAKAKGKKPNGGKEDDAPAARFPMKVDGWTFTNPQEFLNLTSHGCACCGEVPNLFNKYNPHITVYSGVGAARASIMDAEFICGKCISEDTKALDKAAI